MPIRTPSIAIVVARNNRSVVPPVGKPFEFTAEEIKDAKRMHERPFADAADSDPKQPEVPPVEDSDEDDGLTPPAESAPVAKPAGTRKARAAATEDL